MDICYVSTPKVFGTLEYILDTGRILKTRMNGFLPNLEHVQWKAHGPKKRRERGGERAETVQRRCSGPWLARGLGDASQPGSLDSAFSFFFYQCFSSKEKGRREDTSRTREARGGMEEGDVAKRKEKQQQRKGRKEREGFYFVILINYYIII